MRPSPWQVGHAFCNFPLPPQRGQVRLNFIAPAICETEPVPLHCGQVTEPLGASPEPLHVAQTSWRVMLSLACVPRMACQKSIFSAYSRSEPFSGSSACSWPPPRRKNCEKISENPPLPPVPL